MWKGDLKLNESVLKQISSTRNALGEKAVDIVSNRGFGKMGIAISCLNGYYVWSWVEQWVQSLGKEISYQDAENYAKKLYDEHFNTEGEY